LNVFEQVRSIASDLLGIPAGQISAASSPENIETWDSVQHLNFVLAIEEKFGLQLSPEEMEQMKNIGDIVKLVEGKLQGAPS
jgi:acyl carrier protein